MLSVFMIQMHDVQRVAFSGESQGGPQYFPPSIPGSVADTSLLGNVAAI